MLARLWWKEWRTMWPLWVCMPVLAGMVQVLSLALWGSSVGGGALIPIAQLWAAIYALAVSSAAFAGEREHGTLLWLDVLPVSRTMLWGGKASFALVSTLLLVLPLTFVGLLGTSQWTALDYRVLGLTVGFGALLIECVAWGVFWSALVRNALLAGILAVVSAGVGAGYANTRLSIDASTLQRSALLRLGLAAVLCGVSLLVITRRPSRDTATPRLRRLTAVREWARRAPKPHASANRSLAWLARRQAQWVWLACTGAAASGLLSLYAWTEGRPTGEGFIISGCTFAGFVAGLCVFHPDNRGRLSRFYVHHGVSPLRVWSVKVGAWGILILILASAASVAALLLLPPRSQSGGSGIAFSALVVSGAAPVVYAFVSGLISGLVIERAILAAVVAFGTFILLWAPNALAVAADFFPPWFIAIPALILLLASLAWSRDWTLPTLGAGRWLRLTAWLVVPFVAYVAGAIAYRAWSLPKINAITPPTTTAEGIDGGDAADFYASALKTESGADMAFATIQVGGPVRVGPKPERPVEPSVLDAVVVGEHDAKDPKVVAWWHTNRKAIELIRDASQQKTSGFYVPTTLIPRVHDAKIGPWNLRIFAWLMALDARESAANGDLRQAWDDVRVVWRMSRQASVGMDASWMDFAAELDRKASHMAMLWAQDPHQTRELLHAALDDLHAMPEQVPLADAYRTEAGIWERTTQRTFEELKPFFYETFGRTTSDPMAFVGRTLFLNTWERERARRAGRLWFAYLIEEAEREPGKRDVQTVKVQIGQRNVNLSADWALSARLSTPALRMYGGSLARLRHPVDRALVDRRALVQVLALRSWALAHGGKLPERLAELVPSELTRLPVDPYSGNQFRFESGEARMASPLGWFTSGGATDWKGEGKAVRGARVLSSVGPKDDPILPTRLRGEILFAIPGDMPEPNSNAAPEPVPAQTQF